MEDKCLLCLKQLLVSFIHYTVSRQLKHCQLWLCFSFQKSQEAIHISINIPELSPPDVCFFLAVHPSPCWLQTLWPCLPAGHNQSVDGPFVKLFQHDFSRSLSILTSLAFLLLVSIDMVKNQRPRNFPPGPWGVPFLDVFTAVDFKSMEKVR